MVQIATDPKFTPVPAVCVLSILKSNEFRRAYHQASDQAKQTPNAQRGVVRKIIEDYFQLQRVTTTTRLNPRSFYFAERPVEVGGKFKFLLPGAVRRDLIPGRLFLLSPKTASVQRLVDGKTFDNAVRSIEAVRLTLLPERVNGIISFISDAKKFYANHDVAGAERAIGTALDHFNRAASEGLRKIHGEAEKGKRSNEVAGSRRLLNDLRKALQAELKDSVAR